VYVHVAAAAAARTAMITMTTAAERKSDMRGVRVLFSPRVFASDTHYVFFVSFTANGTRARLVYGASVQGRDSATVAEEDQARRTDDGAHGGLLFRSQHGAHVAQLHGGPVPLFLRRVGTATGSHVPLSSVQERQVCTAASNGVPHVYLRNGH